jgi:hypothetical protein
MDLNRTAVLSNEIRQHLKERININKQTPVMNDNIYLTPVVKIPPTDILTSHFYEV